MMELVRLLTSLSSCILVSDGCVFMKRFYTEFLLIFTRFGTLVTFLDYMAFFFFLSKAGFMFCQFVEMI